MIKSYIEREGKTRLVLAESKALQRCASCDFVVNLSRTFQDADYLFFVLEFCGGGDLLHLINGSDDRVRRAAGGLTPYAAAFYAAEVVLGLEFLRELNIAHRDLKPENVLLHDDGFVKIADFGLSTLCPTTVQRGGPAARKAGFAGTVEYAAPERLQKTGGVTTAAVDWWAFGAILFECVCGRTPFGAATARDLFINVLFRDPAFENAFDDDPFARDLLEGLLLKDRSSGDLHHTHAARRHRRSLNTRRVKAWTPAARSYKR